MLYSNSVFAANLQIAVASNFLPTLEALVQAFHHQSSHRLQLSSGSTGRLYTSIRHGAPYDIFLAADEDSVRRLQQQSLMVDDTVIVYAQGELVVFFAQAQSSAGFWQNLSSGAYNKIALANAQLAPYGRAAEQVLANANASAAIKRVVGANIAQAYLFVYSGAVPLGLVARSQVMEQDVSRVVKIPTQYYDPIRQLGGVLAQSKQQAAAREFMQYLASVEGREIILRHGYRFSR